MNRKILLLIPLLLPLLFLLYLGGRAEPKAPVPVDAALESARAAYAQDEKARQLILDQLEFMPSLRIACSFGRAVPEGSIDVHRSLLVHDQATLEAADFSLEAVFDQMARQIPGSGPRLTAIDLFRGFWATQRARRPADPAEDPRCTDARGTLNGFPYPCRGGEGGQADGSDDEVAARMRTYFPVALVNRIDLAHDGWRNCGEYRMVYSHHRSFPIRSLMIFEAVLPNPRPGCASKCREVARFWEGLSRMSDPEARAAALHRFFFLGISDFRPVVHVDHYSARGVPRYGGSGSGQIRTNTFIGDPWDLREFKTVLDCSAGPCAFRFAPIPVRNTAADILWSQEAAEGSEPLATVARDFQASVLAQVDDLARPGLTEFAFNVPARALAGHHFQSEFPRLPYLNEFNPAGPRGGAFPFRERLAAAAEARGLTAEALVQRAQIQSCGGCHSPRLFGLQILQPGLFGLDGRELAAWPSADFRHVDGQPGSDVSTVYGLSPALEETFLPARLTSFTEFLQAPLCPCDRRFPTLSRSKAELAGKVQDSVSGFFAGKRDVLRERMEILAKDPKSDPKLEAEWRLVEADLARLEDEVDARVEAALADAGIPVPPPAREPLPLVGRTRDWDGLKPEARRDSLESRLRAEAFREPFRRTVTGAMPTH